MTSGKLLISGHARRRMQERPITENDIRSVLKSPDLTRPGDEPGRTIYERDLGKVVCVVTVDNTNPIVVVTVFLREKG